MVELKVRLQILSKPELENLERDVVQLEDLTRRQAQALPKLERRKKSSQEQRYGIFAGEHQGYLPSSIIKKRTEATLSRQVESNLAAKSKDVVSKELLSGAGAPIQNAKAFKELAAKVDAQAKALSFIQRGMSQFTMFGNLATGGTGELRGLVVGAASKILPVGIAIAVAQQVFQIWKDSYGAGGVNDPRKLVLDDVASFIGIEGEVDILSGKQFFANTRTLKIGPQIQTNTERLVDGYARTKLLRSPYNRG